MILYSRSGGRFGLNHASFFDIPVIQERDTFDKLN